MIITISYSKIKIHWGVYFWVDNELSFWDSSDVTRRTQRMTKTFTVAAIEFLERKRVFLSVLENKIALAYLRIVLLDMKCPTMPNFSKIIEIFAICLGKFSGLNFYLTAFQSTPSSTKL